ncbi:polyketide cyclase [Gordonia terrae]|uniref:Polyketide cyclase n=1 Tax=Gordonia terrae TaxID=2055 RepID=A0A2I1R7K1_9ACTN|nr:nuclear transport factor 2 family protein [Gordonia terrae]PKZ65134.1 polyketide cyclase [Gordonia terrae]
MIDQPASVRRLLDAVNDGDTEAFLESFPAGGRVDDWGRIFDGHNAIRRWSDAELIGKKATLTPTAALRNGEVVTVIATVGGQGYNGPSTFTFTLRGDRVTQMTIRE